MIQSVTVLNGHPHCWGMRSFLVHHKASLKQSPARHHQCPPEQKSHKIVCSAHQSVWLLSVAQRSWALIPRPSTGSEQRGIPRKRVEQFPPGCCRKRAVPVSAQISGMHKCPEWQPPWSDCISILNKQNIYILRLVTRPLHRPLL